LTLANGTDADKKTDSISAHPFAKLARLPVEKRRKLIFLPAMRRIAAIRTPRNVNGMVIANGLFWANSSEWEMMISQFKKIKIQRSTSNVNGSIFGTD